MRKRIILTFLILICIFIAFDVSEAACNLNLKNLTIASQTSSDKADIIRLQSILYINNLYNGPITGYYGKLTESAINSLKNDNNFNPDGIVDNDVIKLLCSKYAMCPFRSFLEKGDDTPIKEIKFIQYFLRLLPDIYPEKLVTGYFGAKTETAIKRLQTNLGVNVNGKIDIATGQKFCEFFNLFNSDLVNTKTSSITTSPIFQTLCLAFPKQVKTGESVLFISQILGGNSPYNYIWNNQTSNNEKTFKASFSKAGKYTVNLKVIDNKGNISSTSCSVIVSGDTLANILDIDNLSFGNDQNQMGDSLYNTSQSSTSTTDIDIKAFYKPMEKYINNPIKLDAEVLPVEIVKGDPIKINIINIPQDIRDILISQWKVRTGYKLKAYWTGDDIVNQSLDRIVLNDEWYSHLSDGKVPVTFKQWSVFAGKTSKTMGWFDLPSAKLFIGDENGLSYSNYYVKGYNPKDDWSIYQKGLYVNYTDSFYKNNKNIKKEIVNYFSFNHSGSYNIRFNIYFTNPNNNKEYLIAYTDIPLQVIDKPVDDNYVKVYITPGASINSPSCIAGYTNTVPEWTEYPYRDLDGKFLGYNWQLMFVNDDDNGGGLWNYLNLTNIIAPNGTKSNLITGQDGLFKDWERWFNIGTLGSKLYRAFQSDPNSLFYLNPRQPLYQDKYMCGTWYNVQTKTDANIGGITGGGFRLGNVYYNNPDKITGSQTCRGICFQTTDLPDVKNKINNKKNNSFYPDLIIKDYKMENVDKNSGRFIIKYLVKNIGGANFRVNDYNVGIKISCQKSTVGGVDLNIFHIQSNQIKKVDYGITLTHDIKAGEEMWISGNTNNKEYCPAAETMIGCIIDPFDIVEETDEKNNRLNQVRINCDMPTTTTTKLNTTVTSKQTSVGVMYNLLTNPNQIHYCDNDRDCTIKNGTVYCTHRYDSAPVTPVISGQNVYFDKTCKCISKRCQAI